MRMSGPVPPSTRACKMPPPAATGSAVVADGAGLGPGADDRRVVRWVVVLVQRRPCRRLAGSDALGQRLLEAIPGGLRNGEGGDRVVERLGLGDVRRIEGARL